MKSVIFLLLVVLTFSGCQKAPLDSSSIQEEPSCYEEEERDLSLDEEPPQSPQEILIWYKENLAL